MDLSTITSWRAARGRADLALAPGEVLLGGGTWLFSEPQPDATGLVDLTALGWTPFEIPPEGGLRVAATCTIEELLAVPWSSFHPWLAALVRGCVDSFVMSFKIQHTATVGGNLCLGLPAGAMISLLAGLGAEVEVWTPSGGVRRQPVASFVTGVRATTLAPGEVLRAVVVPAASLTRAAVMRRVSLATHGRSGTLVVGRLSSRGEVVLTVTAGTTRPMVLDVPLAAAAAEVRAAVAGIDCWYADPHGPPDWRAATTSDLAVEVCRELRAS